MPSPLYHVGATAICTHAGQATTITTNSRVFVSGQPVAVMGDTTTVAACPFFFPPSGPVHPCVRVQWITGALRVKIGGKPALLQTSPGICLAADQAPQGPPTIIATQLHVMGT